MLQTRCKPNPKRCPIWLHACLWLCLPALLSACGPRQITRPERIETERRVWIPVPEERTAPLPYLAPPTTLEACLKDFAPEAYSIIEQANTDRSEIRQMQDKHPPEGD